jgi:effector-binding domain-containing protein
MTNYELISAFISLVALIISFFALRKSSRASTAYIELYIHELITHAKEKVSEISIKIAELPSILNSSHPDYKKTFEAYGKVFNSAVENNLNAYEGACAIYIDGKIDKERFKKTHIIEIRQLVENEGMKRYFEPATTTRFKAILKVYNEWENLEQ